jgi:hypothetical protein
LAELFRDLQAADYICTTVADAIDSEMPTPPKRRRVRRTK